MTEQTVHFQPFGRRIETRVGATLMELGIETGVPIESVCASAGRCGKCRVMVTTGKGLLSPPTHSEWKTFGDEGLAEGARLACQARIASAGHIVVEVPEESRRGHHRLLATGIEPRTKLEPAVTKVLLKIPPASLKDVRADDDRVLDMLMKSARIKGNIMPGVHGKVPSALRDRGWTVTATLFQRSEVIRMDPGDATNSLWGVAVDIGTTKMVAYLIDLIKGDTVQTESMPNPQIPYGEDLMSRISYTSKEKGGLAKLQGAVVEGLNGLISTMCKAQGIAPEDILEVMVVGNTAMHHIFFGIPPVHLAKAPYAPVVRAGLSMNPSHIGLDVYPFGRVSSLPNIAGFVGADALADLLSSGLYEDKKVGMVIDIGTNTEIIAGNKDRMISCSCASGPAFEGAHISSGMRASTGAIEKVWIDPQNLDVKYTTVDGAPPVGICGSGIVDAVSELFRVRVIDPSGKFRKGLTSDRVRKGHDGTSEFVLAWSKDGGTAKDIAVTQHDVQEIQLAKAAIFTGVSVLMRRLRVKCSDLQNVYAAGAFGTYVDATSAINIGMYPDVPLERIRFIGNAAGSGARLALKSVKYRDLAERLSREVEYVELAAEKDFQTEFAKAMFLPHRDTGRFPGAEARLGRPL